MNKIDVTKWQAFKITDFFQPVSILNKLTKIELEDNGNIPVYSSEMLNNGICGYTNKKPEFNITKDQPFYLIFGDHTKSMNIASDSFCVMDNVKVLVPKISLSIMATKFITTIWQAAIPNLGYSRHWSIAEKADIVLPITNKKQPNWEYMESYMKNIMQESEKNIENIKSIDNKKNKIKIDSWQKFEISKLFTIKSPTKRNIKTYRIGNIPYVSSGSINNGIVSYLEPNNNENIEKGNCITVSPLDGSSFYQENDFIGRGGAGSAISLLYNENITKHSALFISTIIKISAEKFNYNDALTSDNLKFLNIELPILYNEDGSYFIDKEKKYSDKGYVPDWDYMENYMKNIIRDTQTKLDKLFDINKEILKNN